MEEIHIQSTRFNVLHAVVVGAVFSETVFIAGERKEPVLATLPFPPPFVLVQLVQ
jgi:hypothetical protein